MKGLMLMMTFSPMSMRPSRVAEPMCGSSTTLSSLRSLGLIAGSRSKTSSPAPAISCAPPHQPLAFDEPPRRGEDERHGHVGGVLGEYARRVGDRDPLATRRRKVDVVRAGAEGSDELQARARLRNQLGVDAIGHRGH